MPNFTQRALRGNADLRLRLLQTSAIGVCAAASLMAASTAQAQEECGVPTSGTVTCVSADNPYADGITYIAPGTDLTVVLQNGVRVDTSGSLNSGVRVLGDDAITVNGANNTIITTDGVAAFGAQVSNTTDSINVNLDRIVTSGANAAGVVASSSTGAVTVKTNNIKTSGAFADAINASTATGDITIQSDAITTTGANAVGINANSGFADIAITSGTISTTGADSDAINAASAGTATVDAGAITTTGLNADGIVATGVTGADVTFTSIATTGQNANGVLVPAAVPILGPLASASATVKGGSVSTVGATSDGVRAIAGTGTSTVNVTGNISTQGANSRGIFASGPTGVTVTNGGTISTAGATSNGVDASSTTGAVSVTVRNVTTTGASSNAVLVNAADGNAAVTVNGALNASGAGASALTVNSGANAVVNVAAGGSAIATQGNSINIASVGTSTLNNAGTIGNNTGDFALVATGGPITINNSGTLSSDIVLTGGADRINNSGTFAVLANPDFGAGADVFANTGSILVGTGATATVSPVFTGLESLTNTGTIDLRNGRTGDTLTLPGTYAGTNGTVGLDILLNGTTNPSDQLIVGGAATGTTTIQLNQLAGSLPVFNSGTVLVNAANGSAATAFDLPGGFLDAGFVRYEIDFNAANGDFALTGAPSDTAYRTINYVNGIRSLWLVSADAVTAQMRLRRDELWAGTESDTSGRFWTVMHASTEDREGQRDFNTFGQSRQTDLSYEQNYFGGQIGLDITGGSGERGGFAAGLTGGYVSSMQNFAGSTDRVKYDVANAGAYASFTSGNFFINGLGKYDYYWGDMRAANGTYTQDFKGGVYGGQAEVGIRFGSDAFFIEPAARISYIKNDFDDLTPIATNISFDEDEGLRGRAGARIGTQFPVGGSTLGLYAGANYVHEFQGEDTVIFTGGGQTLSYTNDKIDDFGEAIVGLTFVQAPGISAFLEGNYTRSFNRDGANLGIEGVGGRAGFRVKF